MKIVLCEDTEWLLSEEAFSIYASCMYHPTYREYRAQMEDCLHDPSVKVFVCENRGRKTGMMVLKRSGAAAEIIGIAVSDDTRRKGIGKKLIQNVIESEGTERIKAQTDDDSIGFYRKCGFSEEKKRIDYPDGSVVRYTCILCKQTASSGSKKGKTMKLKNVLIVVKNIERSRQFYRDLFGLDMILDNDGNMILTEGLVLQEEKYWKAFLGRDIIPENNACELYFEESDIEGFIEKLEQYYPEVKYVNRLMTHSWGQKVIRFYDPDGNLIEVGTPM